MKPDFEIPHDIKNDLMYCQRALTNYILIHQKLASCAPMLKMPEGRLQKSLRSIERDIVDIGDEQKLLFNRLRFHIDYHLLTKNAKLNERERLTNYVRNELKSFARINDNDGDIKPINVQPRLSKDALHIKHFREDDGLDDESTTTTYSRGHSSRNSLSDDVKTESGSDEDKLEILIQPDDVVHNEQRVYAGPRKKVSKPPQMNAQSRPGQSLLKPIHERNYEQCEDVEIIRVVRPEIGIKKFDVKKVEPKSQPQPVEEPKPQSAAINLVRMRLAAALCKAKETTKTQANRPTIRIETESPETVSPVLTVKCDTPLSSSQSSNASSTSSSIELEPIKDELDPAELGQETFLRMFGLCTPAYTEYLMNRRPQRKKRTCTSTERMDFHYGKFELFEKQFSKRNKRQFLYSPPATRAKRRIGSNGSNPSAKETAVPSKRTKGIKSNASSSSSLSSNGSNSSERVCLTCYKRNNLLQCQKCCGQYHAGCHISATEIVIRKMYCPDCVKQGKLGNIRLSN